LEFNDASAAYLGIGFGVNVTTVALADARGEIRVRRDVKTIHGNAEAAIAAAVALVEEVCAEAGFPRDRLQAVGATIPGLVDSATGRVALAPNLGWKDAPVRDMLAAALSVPVVAHNVTSAGAIAEGRVGAAKGVRSFVSAYVGAGVGAGIVIDGHMFGGTQGFSGEIGHCAVVDGGPPCACGMHGCLEEFVSDRAIVRAAKAALAAGEQTTLSTAPSLDVPAVVSAAAAGDAVAVRILTEVGKHLGVGISYLVNILDPQMIVLGGGVLAAGDVLLSALRQSLAHHCLKGAKIPVVISALGEDAGLIGAVFAAMDQSVRSYRVVATGERVALG
jgi:glucokinase-like ROK family protein